MTTVTEIKPDQELINDVPFDTHELTGKLVARMVEEFKALPNTWQAMGEQEQDDTLSRLRNFANDYVSHAVDVIVSEDRPTLQAILEQVTAKDGIKATITMPKYSPDRHELIDAQGKDIIVVVADAAQYMDGAEKVRAEPDQKPLIGEEYGDE